MLIGPGLDSRLPLFPGSAPLPLRRSGRAHALLVYRDLSREFVALQVRR